MSELATIPNNGTRTTALSPRVSSGDILSDPVQFEHFQRVAKMYSSSMLIPEHMRGKVADVMIAFAMARELGENPLVVMQSIYIVSGKAGWSATYMIARANRSGVFKGRIRWREQGEGENLVVTAYAALADTGEEVAVKTSMRMALAENWTKNAKYKSMPEQMLRYRSATMLIRLYAPEVMLGRTSDEVDDYAAAGADAYDAPTGDLADIIDEPEAVTASDGVDVVVDAVETEQQPENKSDEPKPRDFSNFEQFAIALSEYLESRDVKADDIKGLLNWAKLNTAANKVGKEARDARLSIYNDIVNGKPVNGITI